MLKRWIGGKYRVYIFKDVEGYKGIRIAINMKIIYERN